MHVSHGFIYRPNRAARGYASATAQANNTFVALYNNSTGAELLALLALTCNAQPTMVLTYFASGQLAGTAGTVSPVHSGYGLPPGLITWGNLTTIGKPDFGVTDFSSFTQLSTPEPFAIIEPGQSLVLVGADDTPAGVIRAGFLYQLAHQKDLLGKPCDICEALDG
jgi:hypothetical protein